MSDLLPFVDLRMSVAKFLEAFPQTIPFFVQKQLSCVGCSMAAFDTLEDVSRTYGFKNDELLKAISKFLATDHTQ